MLTQGKSSRKHGQDANLRRVFERTRSRCKPKERLRENTVRMQTDDLPPNRFTVFSNISWHSTCVFTWILGHGSSTLAPSPLNSTRVFSAISSGDQFLGSRGENPPLALTFWAYCCIPGVFLRVFCKSASEGSSGEGGERSAAPWRRLKPQISFCLILQTPSISFLSICSAFISSLNSH